MTTPGWKFPNPEVKKKIVNGVACYSIGDAAKMLGTNALGVRNLIDEGRLEAVQSRVNSRTFVVTGQSIIDYKYANK